MSAIRFPATAVPLLTLCKGHGEHFIFRTHADLLAFVAAYGFKLVRLDGHRLKGKTTSVDVPNAISLEVFDNRGLYANLLMIALAHDPARAIAEDEELLVKLIEQYADVGATLLASSLGAKPPAHWSSAIAALLADSPDDTVSI